MKNIKIIAEIGINHNGDLKIAKDLIDCAKKAGCDIVKFQKRDIDLVYSKEQLDSLEIARGAKLLEIKKKVLSFQNQIMMKLIIIALT